ncbi:hypothetical protein GDO86_019843 [Hymenochirus boettgeri]|uniref:Uncharacterized protein n=1 Tax=Hymenochirus boettgeri TaxID=247094 RepID=A0A8T2IL38_9PIPI|nr:hypothetical protein GDO86_019843 [Hymenochirus boettgeri]
MLYTRSTLAPISRCLTCVSVTGKCSSKPLRHKQQPQRKQQQWPEQSRGQGLWVVSLLPSVCLLRLVWVDDLRRLCICAQLCEGLGARLHRDRSSSRRLLDRGPSSPCTSTSR